MKIAGLSVAVLAIGAAACRGYRTESAASAASSRAQAPAEVATSSCLDVTVDQVYEPQADGPVAGITLGNRCDGALGVDFAAIRATGRSVDGSVSLLIPHGPRAAIRSAVLDAQSVIREVIEYQVGSADDWPLELCLDLADVSSVEPIVVCIPLSGPDAIVAMVD